MLLLLLLFIVIIVIIVFIFIVIIVFIVFIVFIFSSCNGVIGHGRIGTGTGGPLHGRSKLP